MGEVSLIKQSKEHFCSSDHTVTQAGEEEGLITSS